MNIWVAVYQKVQREVIKNLLKGLKVLQKRHIFSLYMPFWKFWGYLSENTTTLLPNDLNFLILKYYYG